MYDRRLVGVRVDLRNLTVTETGIQIAIPRTVGHKVGKAVSPYDRVVFLCREQCIALTHHPGLSRVEGEKYLWRRLVRDGYNPGTAVYRDTIGVQLTTGSGLRRII